MEIKLDVAQNCSGNHKIIERYDLGLIEMDEQPFLNFHKVQFSIASKMIWQRK